MSSHNEQAPDLHQATVDFAVLAASDQLAFEAGVWKLGPFKNHESPGLSKHFLTLTLQPESEEQREQANGIEIRLLGARRRELKEQLGIPPEINQLWGAEYSTVRNPQSPIDSQIRPGAFSYFWHEDGGWRTDSRAIEAADRLGALAEEYRARKAVIETVRRLGGKAVSEHLAQLDEITASFEGVTETFVTSEILELLDYSHQSTRGDAAPIFRYGMGLAAILQDLRIHDESVR